MKAVVLVGGFGTRLRPLTCNVPKVMTPVLNRPLLEHVIERMQQHGIKEIVFTVSHLADVIEERMGDGSRFGVRLIYVKEESPLGTSGAVKNAEHHLSGPFFVFNGDMLTGIDLAEMMSRHREVRPKATIALTPVDDPTLYGVVERDSRGMVTAFVEKPSWDKVRTNMINAGIYILEPDVLKHIPSGAPSMFENYLFPKLLEMGEPLLGYPSDAYWIDLGTTEKYLKANQDLLLERGREIVFEGTSQVDPEAHLEPPVLIGEGTTIGRRARIVGPTVIGPHCNIGDSVTLERTVLWDRVEIGAGSWIKESVIATGSRIEENCQLVECIIGDEVLVGRGVGEWGAKIPPHSSVAPEPGEVSRPRAPLPPSHLCPT